GGNAGLLPVLFFVVACLLSTIGPGAVASVALVAPIAMPACARAGVPNFLSAIMIGCGANAGNLSPISAVGAMVDGILAKIGLGGHEWRIWTANFVAHVAVAVVAWLMFGGLRLYRSAARADGDATIARLDRSHWTTIVVTAL